ncbi:MAG: LysR substrate-binding domain-containing protein [Paracoccaceae bacterium]
MPMLSLRQMEIIYAVARHGSVTDAARALGISQPAVSSALQECNRITGVMLFERKAGRLKPTPETGALLPEIERVQNAVQRVGGLLKDYHRIPRGNLSIAAVPIMADNLVPEAMARSAADLADIAISLVCRDYEDIPDLLDAGRIDVGLSSSIIPSTSADVIDLWTSELILVMSDRCELARLPQVTAADLARHPLIAFNRNIPIGLALDNTLQATDEPTRVAVEVSQTSTAIAFARQDQGVALIHPLGMAAVDRTGLCMRRVEPIVPFWNQILLPRTGHLNRATQNFLAALRKAVPRIRAVEKAVLSAAV